MTKYQQTEFDCMLKELQQDLTQSRINRYRNEHKRCKICIHHNEYGECKAKQKTILFNIIAKFCKLYEPEEYYSGINNNKYQRESGITGINNNKYQRESGITRE